MLCQKCNKNEANTHIKTVINGKLTEYALCSTCAKEMGYSNFLTNLDFHSLLGGLFENLTLSDTTEKCPKCGATFDDIISTGKIGCAECYQYFDTKLKPTIQRIHGTTEHKGKSPGKSALSIPEKRTEIAISSSSVVEQKKLQLRNAIEEQRFEDAAKLRDEIKVLENKHD